MQISILDFQQQRFPHLQELIDSLRIYSSERLWKQLSDSLLQYIKDPGVNSGTNLKELYEGFVNKFYHEIDEFKLVRFLIQAADQYGDFQNRIDFLDTFIATLSDPQAAMVLRLKQGYYLLQQSKIEETDEKLKNYKQQIERLQEVEPLVYSLLYYLAFNFYRFKRNYEEFYQNALQYLAYTPDHEIVQSDKVQLSLEMGLAILISPQIYNYSELLSQPVLLSLKESPQAWIFTFLEIFNQGNVQLFKVQLQQFSASIQSQPLLANNMNVLEEKIRIMAFLELAFQLPKNNRICTFQQISQVTHLNEDLIEALVMRTISKGLVKGRINQINKTVSISYIVPRVLSKDKIDVMMKKFENWQKTLTGIVGDIQTTKDQLP